MKKERKKERKTERRENVRDGSMLGNSRQFDLCVDPNVSKQLVSARLHVDYTDTQALGC